MVSACTRISSVGAATKGWAALPSDIVAAACSRHSYAAGNLQNAGHADVLGLPQQPTPQKSRQNRLGFRRDFCGR